MLPHPCRVLKVVGVEERVVVTIAEDGILRIWDRKKPPFHQDMSLFTGIVDSSLVNKRYGIELEMKRLIIYHLIVFLIMFNQWESANQFGLFTLKFPFKTIKLICPYSFLKEKSWS